MVLALDEGSEAMLCLEMLSLRLQLSCHGNSLPCKAHKRFSNTGVSHLFVDVISKYVCHFLYRTFLIMAAEYDPILQEGSNFCKKTAKKLILSPKFQKVRFERHKSSQSFRTFMVLHYRLQ